MSPYPAIRRNGACTGSLWKSHGPGSPSLDGSSLGDANQRQRAHEFCVLVCNTLLSYSDVWAYAKGDPPTSEIRIVGASAWNSPIAKLAPSKSVDFLAVTYSGTHVRCSAPTPSDKDEWLAALHAGLEGNVMEYRLDTLMVLSQRHDGISTKIPHHYIGNNRTARKNRRDCRSLKKSDMVVQFAMLEAMAAFDSETSFCQFVPPLPRIDNANTNGSEMYSSTSLSGGIKDASTHLTGYCSPCDDRSAPPSLFHCTGCGKYPPEHAMRIDAAPLPEYGMEVRVDLCHDCWIAQGVLQHVRYLGWLYEVEASDRAAVRMAWDQVKEVLDQQQWESAGLESRGSSENNDVNGEVNKGGSSSALHLLSSSTSQGAMANALLELAVTESFVTHRQRSDTLEFLCQELEKHGVGYVTDFLESVQECAEVAEAHCHKIPECGAVRESIRPKEKVRLKREAFEIAGDMSAALKLLYEYALPSERRNSLLKDSGDMLAAILEFFLDLCEEGQMDAVAFFWPQICHIHMLMLPARDVEAMVRVELMEDFLLTVSTRFSVHLALNLVWGLTADLEESLGSTNCNPLSRRRRFAIIRFVSELESLLFDFEGGWGGGGVSLHGMLVPSQQQASLLKDSVSLLQLRRRFGSHYLTKSVRHDKLRAEAMESVDVKCLTPEDRSFIAQNAAYFLSHIGFARKLGDIAEKLRFMSVECRSDALREELKKINTASKFLGGDPLNSLCGGGCYQRAVHIPVNEGHVFRSKERTPVLLLAELLTDIDSSTAPIRESLNIQHFGVTAGLTVGDKQLDIEVTKEAHQDNHASSCESSEINSLLEHPECDNDSVTSQSKHVLPALNGSLSSTNDLTCESPDASYHGVLNLTPRASEATKVTDEGKEMMADLIAKIVNQKNHPLDSPHDDVASGKANNSHGDRGEHDQHHRTAEENVIPKSPTGKGESHSPLTNPQSTKDFRPAVIEREEARKMSALAPVFPQTGGEVASSANFARSPPGIHLTADGQFRRDVLFAIMERGMRGSNVIAKGAASAARHAIQAMDRKRAIALINQSVPEPDVSGKDGSNVGTVASIDEGEVMEALRLLIIQNQVAQENLSNENGDKVNPSLSSVQVEDGLASIVDAGEVDHRLAGCGQISSSVLSALRLWKGGIVSNGELLELVQKDLQFLKQSAVFGSAEEKKLVEGLSILGPIFVWRALGREESEIGSIEPTWFIAKWDLVGYIVKSNDDLRQEAFVMQLIRLCEEAFQTAGLKLWVHPYTIVATGLSTGIIECVRNAMSFDSLKKRPGYGSDGLVGHFQRMTETAADPFKAHREAKQNFVSSLAAYSLMSYLFLFKDRHNGNLLLDTSGHVVHIDFGFVFGTAPGGSFSLEQSTPFKLTDEMLEVMGGLGSPLFSEFVTQFCCGFLALQAHADTFLTLVEITCRGSNYDCFDGKDPEEVVSKLRERFCPELNKSQTVAYALDLIKFATSSYGTKQYDYFQYLSQGIAT